MIQLINRNDNYTFCSYDVQWQPKLLQNKIIYNTKHETFLHFLKQENSTVRSYNAMYMDGSIEDDQKVHSNMCNIWQSCHWVFDEKTTVCTLIEHVQSMYIQITFKNDLYTSCIDCLPLIATKSLDVQWDYDDMEYNSLKKSGLQKMPVLRRKLHNFVSCEIATSSLWKSSTCWNNTTLWFLSVWRDKTLDNGLLI